MVQTTRRDDEMLAWLSVVGLANMDAVRWALASYQSDADEVLPVSLRRAQQWSSRLEGVGLLGRAQPGYQKGLVVWATREGGGRGKPNLHRQTTRHELAVASASARYLARGFSWSRDRKPRGLQDHQADGVAIRGNVVELVEVELTAKTLSRYRLIHTNHASRLTDEGVARVTYLCTPEASRAVSREADRHLFRDLRSRVVTFGSFDVLGRWVGDENAPWTVEPPRVGAGDRPVELWDRSVG